MKARIEATKMETTKKSKYRQSLKVDILAWQALTTPQSPSPATIEEQALRDTCLFFAKMN